MGHGTELGFRPIRRRTRKRYTRDKNSAIAQMAAQSGTVAARGGYEVVRSHRAATCRGGTLTEQPNREHIYNVIIIKIALTRSTLSPQNSLNVVCR